jgi:hypothetical protein
LARHEHRLGRLDPTDLWLVNAGTEHGQRASDGQGVRAASPVQVVDAPEHPDRPCQSCHSDIWRERPPGRGGGWVCDACHPDSGRLHRECAAGRRR